MPRKIILHKRKRYWFHVSTTLTKKEITLCPRGNEGFNRNEAEPEKKRICVSPSLEQCLVAIPYGCRDRLYIYRTKSPIVAHEPHEVFDASVTEEGWIFRPTRFKRLGQLNLNNILDDEGNKIDVIHEVAPFGSLSRSRKAYRWWRKLNPWKHILKS